MAVASYALEYSVTQTEAQRRLERIEPIQEILASVRGLEAARTAGWGIDHRGSFTGWVLLTGDEPAGAEAAALADAHSDVEIRTGAQHSYAELQAAQRGLAAQFFAARSTVGGALGNTGAQGQAAPDPLGELEGAGIGAGVAEVVTFLETDMAGNAVRVGIDPGLASDVGPLGTVSELNFDQGAAVVAGLLDDHIEVPFTVADGRDLAPETGFQGGEEMTWCTSGFTARRPRNGGGYDYGVITAGHCRDNGPNETHVFRMNGVVVPFVYGWLAPRADAQFHRIPAPTSGSRYVLDDFLCRNPGSYPNPSCDVTGTEARAKMKDAYVCHRGKNSGISCGRVISIDFTPEWSDDPCLGPNGAMTPCQDVFVRVHGPYLRSCDGDSGGPVYRGGTAYGIHAAGNGGTNCTQTGRTTIFSAIREVESFLGVEVLTEPVTLSAP
ncbi:MAG: hypothetical protein F4Y28_02260 [Acidimicrobiia bacterium]|nr:hypothetical protein [Acidimicrobiia bacterium]